MQKEVKDKAILNTIRNIYKINLNVKKNERIIVFTDDHSRKLKKTAQLIAEIGKKYSNSITFLEIKATGSHGKEPPQVLWRNVFGTNAVETLKTEKLFNPLLNKRVSKTHLKKIETIIKKYRKEAVKVVIALSYYSTTHTKFREMLTKVCGVRYASMPLFDESMLKSSMRVNWKRMAERSKAIQQRVNRAKGLEIKTPNGTHIVLSKTGRKAKADTGIITKKGTYSNLPAGEVFLAPLEDTAEGRLVLEWAPTRKLKSQIILNVKNGKVISVKGSEKYAQYLKTKLKERMENRNIAELGIGTNDKASRPDNILESEKIMGTVHIAIGDNSSFGGTVSTPFHQDFVFFKPTVTLSLKGGKSEELLKNGKLQGK